MDRTLWQSRWKVLVIYVTLVAIFMVAVFLTFFTNIFRTSRAGSIPQLVWFLVASLFLVAVILILSKTVKMLDALEENSAKLERIAEALEKNRSILTRIDQGVRLSETAKSIVSRAANQQYLREAVFAKLQQQDFKSAYEIIDEIAGRPEYKEFAEQLRAEADKCRDALDQYLTSSEGLALQEAAKDVFKTKLHNLGVQFSLAVSGKSWAKALQVGREIARNFPNSKIAGEIREKLSVLEQRAQQGG